MGNRATSAAGAPRRPQPHAPITPKRAKSAALILDGATTAPVPSPVHDLQDLLATSVEPLPNIRPVPRATLLFVVTTSIAFWVAVAVAVRAAFH